MSGPKRPSLRSSPRRLPISSFSSRVRATLARIIFTRAKSDGLRQVVGDPVPQGRRRRSPRGLAGDHDRLRALRRSCPPPEQVEAAAVGQVQVDEEDVGRVLGELLARARAGPPPSPPRSLRCARTPPARPGSSGRRRRSGRALCRSAFLTPRQGPCRAGQLTDEHKCASPGVFRSVLCRVYAPLRPSGHPRLLAPCEGGRPIDLDGCVPPARRDRSDGNRLAPFAAVHRPLAHVPRASLVARHVACTAGSQRFRDSCFASWLHSPRVA